jgi:hypothetical protein
MNACRELRERLLVHVADRDLRASFVQPSREMRAHSLSAAGDDDLHLIELHDLS